MFSAHIFSILLLYNDTHRAQKRSSKKQVMVNIQRQTEKTFVSHQGMRIGAGQKREEAGKCN